eukprot:719302-Rhodomonas_salina.1
MRFLQLYLISGCTPLDSEVTTLVASEAPNHWQARHVNMDRPQLSSTVGRLGTVTTSTVASLRLVPIRLSLQVRPVLS